MIFSVKQNVVCIVICYTITSLIAATAGNILCPKGRYTSEKKATPSTASTLFYNQSLFVFILGQIDISFTIIYADISIHNIQIIYTYTHNIYIYAFKTIYM